MSAPLDQSADSHELKPWRAIYLGTFDEISSNTKRRDAYNLAKLGKQEKLKRRFSYVSILGFSCTILITWETVLALFPQALQNGGPAGLVWGFLISWACSLSVYMVIAEMASLAPIAGGQYFWVAILAPVRMKRFLSYLTGWLTTLAWIAVLAVGTLYVASAINGLVVINNPESYTYHAWHTSLIAWAVIGAAVAINTIVAGALPLLEGFVLVLHIVGFIAIMITLLYLGDKGSTESVFFTPYNGGNWPTMGLSYCVGYIGNVGTFVGADSSAHMAEEIEDADRNIPRAIFTTILLNGLTGFGMCIAVLYCLGDPVEVLNTQTGLPFVQVFLNAAGVPGATAMTIIVVLLGFAAATGFIATAARMIWSFARDKGMPLHSIISRVDPSTRVPVAAVALVAIVPCLLVLIYIGSATAYSDIISLTITGLYGSYLIPSACLLWRRTTGQIRSRTAADDDSADGVSRAITPPAPPREGSMATASGTPARPWGSLGMQSVKANEDAEVLIDPPLVWGPWRVPGWLGVANNAFACGYSVFVLFFAVWPPSTPATPATMNYAVLVTGAVLLFAVVYYYAWGRKHYKGPLVDYEVRGVANVYLVERKQSAALDML